MKTTVSQSDYAAMVGKSKGVVSRAVSSGRLPSELAAGCRGPGVIVDVPDGVDVADAARALWDTTASPMPHNQARKDQFEQPRPVDALVAEVKSAIATDIIDYTAPIATGENGETLSGVDLSARLKLETWKLQKAKAEQANLELDKMAGLLVERAEVDYVLADFGNTLRGLLEGLPDRLAGSVARHRGDVNAIHKEIADAAHDVLQEMADLMKRKMEAVGG